MRANRKRHAILHAARANRRDDGTTAKMVLAILAVVAVLGAAVGLFAGFTRLRELWIEQCVITDVTRQVTIETGSHVKPGIVLDGFGLRNGANLALIDFKAKRAELMAKVPNIRTLAVSRKLPDRVVITVGEREPVARLALKGQRNATGRVVDAEGVVFMRRVGTEMLPVIREAHQPGTQPGKTLPPRARAALLLVSLCREQDFAGLNILEVDTSNQDYLVAVLGNYQRAKIAWEGMDEQTAVSRKRLVNNLMNLRDTINSGLGTRAVLWNATEPDRVYADLKEPIQ